MRTLVDMEGSYLSANFFREIVAAESFSYDPSRPKPQFVTLAGEDPGRTQWEGCQQAQPLAWAEAEAWGALPCLGLPASGRSLVRRRQGLCARLPARRRACSPPCPGEILLEKRYDGMSAADAHLQRISDHVSAYLQIVRSQLLATVPKGVVHCIVVPAKDTLLSDLQEEVAGKEEVALRRLLNENEEVARQRDAIKKRLELMERAAAEIMNFRV